MFKTKIFISIITFSFLLIGTSILKNQTREIEKNILNLSEKVLIKEKDLNETQLDFYYLTSPSVIEKQIYHLDKNQYIPMEYSKIFFSLSNFLKLDNQFATHKNQNEKEIQKK